MEAQNTPERKSTRAALLEQIEIFLAANPTVSATGFGWLACENTGLVERLRNGGDTNTENLDRCLDFLQNPHQRRKSYGANRKRKSITE